MNPEVYGFSPETKLITSDYYAYLAAVKQLDNPKIVDINLFATPGIDYVNQTALVNDIISIIEEDRGDAVYVVTTPDKPFGAGDSKSEMYSAEEVVYNLEDSGIDSNYVCTYYPWEQYYDSSNNQYIYLPVTRDVVRNMAYTDNIAYPWYATAGWNRGDINGVAPKRKLKLNEQDVLYEGRINYINSFAKEGDRIWGDKNLQIHDGIMNRISKRRLLIRLKTLLSDACVGLLFDPNDYSMVNTFRSSIKSVLEPIKQNRGITDFRIEIDDSAEARDRLELPARVFIKPTQMLEYINIDLVVTPQGVVWN
jgi:phage tail sheath protein FI